MRTLAERNWLDCVLYGMVSDGMITDRNDVGESPELATTGTPAWAVGIDLSRPSAARAYDYALGGAHNFAVDREFVRALEAVAPETRTAARANRAFLHRTVRFMIEEGIHQFLDIGSGIPTVGNVHEIAQGLVPGARVVYVDIDSVAVAHSRLILACNDRATAIQEDLRRPEAILDHPDTRALLDFGQPVGLILAAILHAIPDRDDPHAIMTRLRDELCRGSFVAISHATTESGPEEQVRGIERMSKQTSTPIAFRTRAEIMRFFTGLALVEPGLVWTSQWRPYSPEDVDDHPERLGVSAGVGRKR
jgi:S-adenosyl methyltransferase